MTVGERNQGLDVLRAVAILAVLFLHAAQAIPELPVTLTDLFAFGWIGVDLFFVLSGFLIARQAFFFETERSTTASLKRFWLKRWLRTFPLYYLVLFVYVVVKPLAGYPFVGSFFPFLFFIQNYVGLDDFVQSWSLCIEEQFYILFPIVYFALRVRAKCYMAWVLPIIVSIVARFLLWKSGHFQAMNEITVSTYARFPLHTHMDGIACGVLLAATFDRWRGLPLATKLCFGVAGIILVTFSLLSSGADIYGFSVVYTYSALAVGFSFLLIAFYDLRLTGSLYWPIHKLALWSYGLYLWNNLLIRVFLRLSPSIHWGPKLILFLLINMLVAGTTYFLVEERFLRLRDRLLQRFNA